MLGAQGLAGVQPQSHPKAGEHPQGYQTATQSRALPALSPTITPVTLRPDSKRVLNEIQGKGPNRHTGGLVGGWGGGEKLYVARTERPNTKASSTTYAQPRHTLA